jgi:CelD/BcsL family acetyltransferase involved in cellulose biosynthesis
LDSCRRNQFSGAGAILAAVTSPTVETEPACPGLSEPAPDFAPSHRLVAVRRPFSRIPQPLWDALAARSPWATPFAAWAFHRSWWDAYGATAHEQTLVVVDRSDAADPDAAPVAIVPLMHRHEVEPDDAVIRSTMRHAAGSPLTPVEPTATAVFFGASYHADYATILSAPGDLPAVADAVVAYLAGQPGAHDAPGQWDVVDLRRLQHDDPAVDALAGAFARAAAVCRWNVTVEQEDVCPVLTLEPGSDFDTVLGKLDKKERHEIRRKLRRAEQAGEVRLATSTEPLADLDAFIDLHQKRWQADGLFPDTAGGERSRRFFRNLFLNFGATGAARLTLLTVGDRLVGSGVHFDDGQRIAYYNAGVDPGARDLSPGVVMVAMYVQQALAAGRRELDFLRGNEPYKYEWGAVDRPIQRILVSRAGLPS